MKDLIWAGKNFISALQWLNWGTQKYFQRLLRVRAIFNLTITKPLYINLVRTV